MSRTVQTIDSTRQQSNLPVVSVGQLPAAFILMAMINFAVGAVLGGAMSVNQALWPNLGLVHGELNPFGWLTMLIYGMTYAVLALLAGLKLPWPALAWVQLICAELGVLALVVSVFCPLGWLVQLGLGLQALAPFLFLANILSAVITSRRRARQVSVAGTASVQASAVTSTENSTRTPVVHREDLLDGEENAEFRRYFGKPAFAKPTDVVGQRGTELALMVFIVAAVWAFAASFGQPAHGYHAPLIPTLLTYYGWIAGTVLSVTMHLYPRCAGRAVLSAWEAQLSQALWVLGMVGVVMGSVSPTVLDVGVRITGAAIGWMAVVILFRARVALRETALPSRMAWAASWCFTLALGVALAFGLDPLSLPALHLLFLGWITTLAYGVGYTLFPYLLRRRIRSLGLACAQIVIAAVGALLMVISFFRLGQADAHALWSVSLGIGGVLATVGFLLFVAQWAFAKRMSENSAAHARPSTSD
jgi:hypothetical protein